MSVAKYSPTVGFSYKQDQKWFEKNGGGFGFGKNPETEYDDDGYDSYGYNEQGLDRAGHSEESYDNVVVDSHFDEPFYPLYEKIHSEWISKTVC